MLMANDEGNRVTKSRERVREPEAYLHAYGERRGNRVTKSRERVQESQKHARMLMANDEAIE